MTAKEKHQMLEEQLEDLEKELESKNEYLKGLDSLVFQFVHDFKKLDEAYMKKKYGVSPK